MADDGREVFAQVTYHPRGSSPVENKLAAPEPYGERGAHPVLFCRAKGPSPDGGAHVVSCDREVMPWLDDDDGYAGAIVRVWAGKETQRPGRCGRRGSSPGKPRDRVAARLPHTSDFGRGSGYRDPHFAGNSEVGDAGLEPASRTSDLCRVKAELSPIAWVPVAMDVRLCSCRLPSSCRQEPYFRPLFTRVLGGAILRTSL